VKVSLKKIYNSSKVKKLRALLNFRAPLFNIDNLPKPSSVSDAFCWRTDNDYKTIFKFTDILNFLYQQKKSSVEILFYKKSGILIKKINLNNLNHLNELVIDSNFLNGIKDYGTFNIFHEFGENFTSNIILSNRCYLGFSKNNNLASFVHGNTYANYKSKNKDKVESSIINKSFFKNQDYTIQNNFKKYSKVELFFANPIKEKIFFSLLENNYYLDPLNSKIIEINNSDIIKIRSNCYFLRPIVFAYLNKYIDVYHA